jgi:N utilization substance protein B
MLYQIDITHDSTESVISNFWEGLSEEKIEEKIKEFASELVRGVIENLRELDARISNFAVNWQLKRMPIVDRNILRLGSFELLFRSDIPPKVSINEAVDLAKKYSGLEAAKFVNAILDKIKIEKDNGS